MSQAPSPSCSPSILDNENVISVEQEQPRFHEWNSDVVNGNPVMSSFFYSQGNYEPYFEGLNQSANIEKLICGNDQAHTSKKPSKKRKCPLGSSPTSYIARREGNGPGHLIKLEVHKLKGSKNENYYSDSDNACISVQYVVREPYDEVMEAAETLIKKIGKKLSDTEQF